MIGFSVSDIIKLLEQVPGWKAVVGLPKRLAELEARVKALETGSKASPGPKDCPICGAVMSVVREKDHPTFGRLGMKSHEMKCDGCGHASERMYQPGKGYS